MKCIRYLFSVLFFLGLLGLPGLVYGQGAACTHYADPNGSGSTCSQGSPCTIRSFILNQASGGDVLCLNNGTYFGFDNMIQLYDGPSGSAGSYITIRALNDGQAYINGNYQFGPLYAGDGRHHWIIEGIDFGQSVDSVLYFNDFNQPDPHDIIVRRSCFFNANVNPRSGASATNQHTILHGGFNNLLEDVCAVGWGRNSYVDGNNTGNVVRRLYARWEGGDDGFRDGSSPGNTWGMGGPATQLDYSTVISDGQGHDTIYENVISVWSAALENQFNTFGACNNNLGWETRTGLKNAASFPSHIGNLFAGMIMYAYPNSTYNGCGAPNGKYAGNRWAPNRVRDNLIDAHDYPHVMPVSFGCELAGGNADIPSGAVNCGRTEYNRITVLRASNQSSSEFPGNTTNYRDCTSIGNCPNPYTGSGGSGAGARLCHRYVNGVLQDGTGGTTATPLWPWPMDNRVKQAIQRAGSNSLGGVARSGWYEANTVSSEVASRFGEIPETCLGQGNGDPPPDPPPTATGKTKTFWKMDEGSGTTIVDATTEQNTGTLTGSPSWGAGRVGNKSLTLNGTTQYSDATVINVSSNAYTWMLWIKGVGTPATGAVERVIVNGTTADSFGFNWGHVAGAFRQAAQHQGVGTEYSAQIPTALSAGVWYHIAGTYDGNALRVYLNGTLQATTTGVAAPLVSTGTLRLGAKGDGTQFFGGSIDNVYLENRAFSAAEILFAYRSTSGTPRYRAVVR